MGVVINQIVGCVLIVCILVVVTQLWLSKLRSQCPSQEDCLESESAMGSFYKDNLGSEVAE